MTRRTVLSLLRGAATAALVVFSLTSWADLPQGEFACQVKTVSKASGLVLVQADSNAEAVTVAGSAIAWEVGGGQSQSIAVVQCVLSTNEAFKDRDFNRFYKSFPR